MDPSKSVSQYKKDNAKLQTKIDQYSKKIGQLTIEKEFLEGKLVSLGLSDRKAMIDPKHKLSVVKQSFLLEVSRAGLYYKPVVNEHYSGEFFRTVFSQKIDVKLSKILSILTLPKYTSAGVL
ncbi:hypothetical protein fh0823_02710 [Francisella halioticida]|uniref:hypothetical protein n=1 Tax=Francisella halioticida TaxID=549298 RepID=UPI001AF4826F|nr:hypothetical protein [Francisella halioticida]BCD90132.1 hypothetical protein fh0823_02710 [Francisella halioticida]